MVVKKENLSQQQEEHMSLTKLNTNDFKQIYLDYRS